MAREKKQIGITLDPSMEARIRERALERGRGGVSAEVRHILSHHFAAVTYGRRRLTAKLSREEVYLILDACNGLFWDASLMPMMLDGGVLLEVADAIRLDHLDRKWHVDAERLLGTLRELSDLEQYALLDLIHEFWNRAGEPSEKLLADFAPAQGEEETKRPSGESD